jgi:hypothetical protein
MMNSFLIEQQSNTFGKINKAAQNSTELWLRQDLFFPTEFKVKLRKC